MKTLVYENYNKFIAATDTIKLMKTKVSTMEVEMSKLVAKMSSIVQENTKINSQFSTNRKEISRLSKIDHALHKIQFIFDLPKRLEDQIAIKGTKTSSMSDLHSACEFYVKIDSLMSSFAPNFDKVQSDCQRIIMPVYHDLLWRFSAAQKSSILDCLLCGQSLVLLSKSTCSMFVRNDSAFIDSDSICKELIKQVQKIFLEDLFSSFDSMDFQSENALSILSDLNANVLDTFATFLRRYESFFIQNCTGIEMKESLKKSLQSMLIPEKYFKIVMLLKAKLQSQSLLQFLSEFHSCLIKADAGHCVEIESPGIEIIRSTIIESFMSFSFPLNSVEADWNPLKNWMQQSFDALQVLFYSYFQALFSHADLLKSCFPEAIDFVGRQLKEFWTDSIQFLLATAEESQDLKNILRIAKLLNDNQIIHETYGMYSALLPSTLGRREVSLAAKNIAAYSSETAQVPFNL